VLTSALAAAIEAVPSGTLCNVRATVTRVSDDISDSRPVINLLVKNFVPANPKAPIMNQSSESCQPRSIDKADGIISITLAANMAAAAAIRVKPLNFAELFLVKAMPKKPSKVAKAATVARPKPASKEPLICRYFFRAQG
jgi:hypothetical protein